MKPFDDGNARLSRSLFLLIGFGFALACHKLVRTPRFLHHLRGGWGGAASAWVWVLQAWVLFGAVVIAFLFVLQFATSLRSYDEAGLSFLGSRRWGRNPTWVRVSKAAVSIGFAAIALPMLVTLILIADGTVGSALRFAQTDAEIAPG